MLMQMENRIWSCSIPEQVISRSLLVTATVNLPPQSGMQPENDLWELPPATLTAMGFGTWQSRISEQIVFHLFPAREMEAWRRRRRSIQLSHQWRAQARISTEMD